MYSGFLHCCFQGKKVLITGHTGFKGSWLSVWLLQIGANVVGVSIDTNDNRSQFSQLSLDGEIVQYFIDIRDNEKLGEVLTKERPDFIFHLAAQALVKTSYEMPLETWQVNVLGTLNLLNSLKKYDHPCAVVIVTSDKCYQNNEWHWGYRENDRLGGLDPYSASKAAAEILVSSFESSFMRSEVSNVRVVTARAGNVIGGGDWSQNRIVPDCIKAWVADQPCDIRMPHSTRPWQHVLEPLSGYLCLAANLSTQDTLRGEAFNFGPKSEEELTVLELVKIMGSVWGDYEINITKNLTSDVHEAGLLKLNCDKALSILNWQATLSQEQAIKYTASWYRRFYFEKRDPRELTNDQILEYCAQARQQGLPWAK